RLVLAVHFMRTLATGIVVPNFGRRLLFLCLLPRPPSSTLFPYTTLFRSAVDAADGAAGLRWALRPAAARRGRAVPVAGAEQQQGDRKSTRLNSSHVKISYAVFCLKKKK